jgi:isoleucyl-tRNA synthetase
VDAARVAGRGLPSRLRLRGALKGREPNPNPRSTSSPPRQLAAARWLSPPASSAACNLGPTKEARPLQRRRARPRPPSSIRFSSAASWACWPPTSPPTQGTGAVHTAPSHGADDFYTGQRYGLDPTCRVDAGGHIHVDPSAWHTPQPPAFDGKKVWAANPHHRRHARRARRAAGRLRPGALLPHCWRCHHPVIFRATEQWFIAWKRRSKRADGSETTFRQLAIEEIDKVVWDPAWGKERITNMIATRPDWCISRQRIWGVPIAVFLCEGCNQPIIDRAEPRPRRSLRARRASRPGTPPARMRCCPQALVCATAAARLPQGDRHSRRLVRLRHSWFAVCEADPDLKTPTPPSKTARRGVLYLEGGDQHRGWFHSSLLTSVALRGRAPYSHVATAGWTLDEQGRAMSKSLGNGVDPVDIANRMGGEIVRLWVASVDFREDMAASENLMQRCADSTASCATPSASCSAICTASIRRATRRRGRAAAARPLHAGPHRDLTEKDPRWYEAFEFHRVYHAVNEFAIVDLSSFYLDVLKDRMYTFAPTSQARRSAQTVLWQITEALVRLVAPILSFTADEVWEYLPQTRRPRSQRASRAVSQAGRSLLRRPAPFSKSGSSSLQSRRGLRVLEEDRQAKLIGKGLEAQIKIEESGELLALLKRHEAGLKEILNVSGVSVVEGRELR